MTRAWRSYKGIGYPDILTGISGASELHSIGQRRLALLLVESRILYDFFQEEDGTVSPNAAGAVIKNMLGSLSLLAAFAKKAQTEPASNGAMKRIIAIDPDARNAVEHFFAEAENIYRLADLAEREARVIPLRPKEPESAITWLCGRRLPEIYTQIFRAKFTTTRLNNPGIAFVQDALRAMQVRNALSEETVISHYKAAQRVTRA